MPRNLFHKAHYNVLAKQIRDLYAQTEYKRPVDRLHSLIARRTIEVFAVQLAKRLKQDNPLFDPILFLNTCSPDEDRYPLGELWK